MRPNDLIIRVGDLVRIEDPRPVLRVGYPKTPEDFLPEVREKHAAALRAIFGEMPVGDCLLVSLPQADSKYVERALRDLAYLACRRARFGGSDRTLHFGEPVPVLQGRIAKVISLRTVKTGTYSPDWEGPAVLKGEQTWRLAELDTFIAPSQVAMPTAHLTKMAPCQHCLSRDLDSRLYPNPFANSCCYYCAKPFDPVGVDRVDVAWSCHLFAGPPRWHGTETFEPDECGYEFKTREDKTDWDEGTCSTTCPRCKGTLTQKDDHPSLA